MSLMKEQSCDLKGEEALGKGVNENKQSIVKHLHSTFKDPLTYMLLIETTIEVLVGVNHETTSLNILFSVAHVVDH